MPTFSIVIPTYNHAVYLPRALDSVVAQTTSDWELIVVDDGSTDETPAVLQGYSTLATIVRTANRGAPAARNTGIAAARGDYIVLLDADDRLLPEALKAFSAAIAKRPGVDLIGAAYASVTADGRRKPRPAPPTTGRRDDDFYACVTGEIEFQNGAVAVRRKIFASCGYDEAIRTYDDIVFYARLVATGSYVVTREVVVEKFAHAGRLRDDYDIAVTDSLKAADLLFDARSLPAELLRYAGTFRARQWLTAFRAHYLRGNFSGANACYVQALRADWRLALRWASLRKALRSFPRGLGGVARKPIPGVLITPGKA